jgi:hypothetical protein
VRKLVSIVDILFTGVREDPGELENIATADNVRRPRQRLADRRLG